MELEITELQKKIYNTYMRTFRKYQNKPFRDRKDFSSMEQDSLVILAKIEQYVTTRNVNLITFFELPFKAAKDNGEKAAFFALKYFSSYRAMKAWGNYLVNKNEQDLDSDIVLSFLKQEFKFIYKFCKINNLKISQYTSAKIGSNYAFISHIANNHITLDIIVALDESPARLLEDEEVSSLLVGNNYKKKINKLYGKYILSAKYKAAVKKFKTL